MRRFRARAPGRVNLIGEHTDYSLLPVLPIAIDRTLTVTATASSGAIITARSEQFDGELRIARPELGEIAAGATAGWHRYVRRAVAALAGQADDRGADLVVSGDLPAGGGLSSSSALTLGVLAALDAAWGLALSRDALVRLAIQAEREASTEGGAMDQTVIAHARAGAALRIDFDGDPPTRTVVPLPELAIIAAYSGQPAPKATLAREQYNQRVIGTRLAAALLAGPTWRRDSGAPPRLRDVAGIPGIEASLETALPERASVARVAAEVGWPPAELARLAAGAFDADVEVPVRPLARHVLREARRVDQACEALRAGALDDLGALLDASHVSLRDDFACSAPALDRLCESMRGAGALGARLTGAGFGGYAVAVCRLDAAGAVLAAAVQATGGPAFEVRASDGLTVTSASA